MLVFGVLTVSIVVGGLSAVSLAHLFDKLYIVFEILKQRGFQAFVKQPLIYLETLISIEADLGIGWSSVCGDVPHGSIIAEGVCCHADLVSELVGGSWKQLANNRAFMLAVQFRNWPK